MWCRGARRFLVHSRRQLFADAVIAPQPVIGRIEIPQRSSLLSYFGVLSFGRAGAAPQPDSEAYPPQLMITGAKALRRLLRR